MALFARAIGDALDYFERVPTGRKRYGGHAIERIAAEVATFQAARNAGHELDEAWAIAARYAASVNL